MKKLTGLEKVNIELTVNEINKILASLAKMPYEYSSDLIEKINVNSMDFLEKEKKIKNKDDLK